MSEKIQKNGFYAIYAVIVAMAGITIAVLKDSGISAVAVNLLFLSVMTILILWADYRGIRVAENTVEECSEIRFKVESLYAEKAVEEKWKYIRSNQEKVFSDPVIGEAWAGFCREGISGKIREDISEELIFERGKRGFCDMVPGSLTALGILGTFLGLILSVSALSFEHADLLDQVMEGLVKGINVAFYTSVYGVLLSILYNLVYRVKIQYITDSLYEFQQFFEQNFEQQEEDSKDQVLGCFEEQQKLLEQIRDALGASLAKNIGEKIGQVLDPAFEQMNRSLRQVVGDFRQEQSASLQYIVNSFVERMMEALDSHIDELGKSVDRLSISQTVMNDGIRKLLREIQNTADDTMKVNRDSREILSEFEAYLKQMNLMEEKAEKTYGIVEEYTKSSYNSIQEQRMVLSVLVNHEEELIKTCRSIQEIQMGFGDQAEQNLKAAEQMRSQQEAFIAKQNEVLDALANYGQKIFESITELKSAQIAASVQYQNYIKLMEKHGQPQSDKWEKLYEKLEAAMTEKDDRKEAAATKRGRKEPEVWTALEPQPVPEIHTILESQPIPENQHFMEKMVRQQQQTNELLAELLKQRDKKKNGKVKRWIGRIFRREQ